MNGALLRCWLPALALCLPACEFGSDSGTTILDPEVEPDGIDGYVTRDGPIPAASPSEAPRYRVDSATTSTVVFPSPVGARVIEFLDLGQEGELLEYLQVSGEDRHFVRAFDGATVEAWKAAIADPTSDELVGFESLGFDDVGVGRLEMLDTFGLRINGREYLAPPTRLVFEVVTTDDARGNPTSFGTTLASCGTDAEVEAPRFALSASSGTCYYLARDALTDEADALAEVDPLDPLLFYRRHNCDRCDDAGVNACSLEVCRLLP